MVIASRRATVANPTFMWEKRAWKAGKSIVAGVDEVGRGAWAGPLVAAAVVLPQDPYARGRISRVLNRLGVRVRDSKMLSATQRGDVARALQGLDIPSAVAEVQPWEIDELGLGAANRVALCRAVEAMTPQPCHALVDWYRLPMLGCTHDAIVRGDSVSFSIALASIVAKLRRDALMDQLGDEYPHFGFNAHKGYGTALHRERLLLHGVTPVHRQSFAPVARMMADEPPAS